MMILLVFALARRRMSGKVETEAQKLRGIFDAIVEVAKHHPVCPADRVRVEAELELEAGGVGEPEVERPGGVTEPRTLATSEKQTV